MEQFKQWVENRHEYARDWKKRTGGKVLGCLCTYGLKTTSTSSTNDGYHLWVKGSHHQDATRMSVGPRRLPDQSDPRRGRTVRPCQDDRRHTRMQFSTGTTGTPKIVPCRHAAATLTAVNMKMVIGLRKGDRYYCPSSPAWGHGIWYGSVGPLIFGTAIGAYAGKFKAETYLEALEEFEITNVSGTPLICRLVRESGKLGDYKLKLRDLSFTGGPLDVETILYWREKVGVAPRSFFGCTEVGVVVLEFPFDDWVQKPGSLGAPMPGLEVAVLDESGNVLPPNQVGQIALKLKDRRVRTGDAAYVDQDVTGTRGRWP